MPRDPSGTYTAPSNSFNPAVNDTIIDPTDWNATLADLSAAMTDSLSRTAQGGMSADLDMNGNDIIDANIGATSPGTGAFTILTASTSVALANNQNGPTTVLVTNTTNGVSALAGHAVTNGTVTGNFAVASASFGLALLANRVYMLSTGGDGIALNNIEADPIVFGVSDVEVGRWSGTVAGRLITGLAGARTGSIDFSGSTSGAITLTGVAVGSGALTLPAATDTLIGKATTDTLTNKTFNTGGTGNVFQIAGTGITAITGTGAVVLTSSPTITTPNIVGTTAVGNAAAGSVGEYVSSTVASGSAVALTTNVAANMTSISLTAGDWDVWAVFNYIPGATTNIKQLLGSISNTSITPNTAGDRCSFTTYDTTAGIVPAVNCGSPSVQTRINVSSTTTIFAVVQCSFTVSTLGAWGSLQARRVR